MHIYAKTPLLVLDAYDKKASFQPCIPSAITDFLPSPPLETGRRGDFALATRRTHKQVAEIKRKGLSRKTEEAFFCT
jgi:hypothetical protein